MRVFVSGGTGFVGRYIVEDLLSAGYAVTVGCRHRPVPGLFSKPVCFAELDLDPDADQIDAFNEAYFFVHAAFDHLPGKYRGGEGDDPAAFRRRNLDGTVKLFETAKRAGIRRSVFLSSRAVYGDRLAGEILSETTPAAPTTLYGRVKLDAEHAIFSIAAPGFATVSLRSTGVYGDLRPNKWDDLFADYMSGQPVSTRAGTEVHGRDLARAVRLMLETETARIAGEIFNVSDLLTDTREILGIVKEATQAGHALPPAAPQNVVSEMDTAKIRALGWTSGGRDQLYDTIGSLAKTLPHIAPDFIPSASARPI